MSILKKFSIFPIFALVFSSCMIGQNKPTISSRSTLIINSPTFTNTVASTYTPTLIPILFNSTDSDLYDNFNNSTYDGSINRELWGIDGEAAIDIIQTEGILSVLKRGGTSECLSVSVNKYHGTEPQTPFYFQTDMKVEKPSPNSLVSIGINGVVKNKAFMATCSIYSNSQNSSGAECVNHWYINDYNLTEHQYFTVDEPKIINQWFTFRIDYDPRATTFTYFINNEILGSYQVIDSESMKKAVFDLKLYVCAPQELNNIGYFDNVRIGSHYQ
jgi:hypothetical protein